MTHCRYCGTECYDIKARDGHEPLCDLNPANIKPVNDDLLAGVPDVAPAVETKAPESDEHTTDDEISTVGPKTAQNGHTPETGKKPDTNKGHR